MSETHTVVNEAQRELDEGDLCDLKYKVEHRGLFLEEMKPTNAPCNKFLSPNEYAMMRRNRSLKERVDAQACHIKRLMEHIRRFAPKGENSGAMKILKQWGMQ